LFTSLRHCQTHPYASKNVVKPESHISAYSTIR
jgi:hypothetical protein